MDTIEQCVEVISKKENKKKGINFPAKVRLGPVRYGSGEAR